MSSANGGDRQQPAPNRLEIGPKSIAGLERAALQVLHTRHPGHRFVIVRDNEPADGCPGALRRDARDADTAA